MVPDLVVLEVGEGDGVEPCDLLRDGGLQGEDDGCAVEPDCVVGWVELDDVLG